MKENTKAFLFLAVVAVVLTAKMIYSYNVHYENRVVMQTNQYLLQQVNDLQYEVDLRTELAEEQRQAIYERDNRIVELSNRGGASVARASVNIYFNVADLQEYARGRVIERGWTEQHFEDLVRLWVRESNWNPNAVNRNSGASGIPQAMPSVHRLPSNFFTCARAQIQWGLDYIQGRYYNPTRAWEHFQRVGWH